MSLNDSTEILSIFSQGNVFNYFSRINIGRKTKSISEDCWSLSSSWLLLLVFCSIGVCHREFISISSRDRLPSLKENGKQWCHKIMVRQFMSLIKLAIKMVKVDDGNCLRERVSQLMSLTSESPWNSVPSETPPIFNHHLMCNQNDRSLVIVIFLPLPRHCRPHFLAPLPINSALDVGCHHRDVIPWHFRALILSSFSAIDRWWIDGAPTFCGISQSYINRALSTAFHLTEL